MKRWAWGRCGSNAAPKCCLPPSLPPPPCLRRLQLPRPKPRSQQQRPLKRRPPPLLHLRPTHNKPVWRRWRQSAATAQRVQTASMPCNSRLKKPPHLLWKPPKQQQPIRPTGCTRLQSASRARAFWSPPSAPRRKTAPADSCSAAMSACCSTICSPPLIYARLMPTKPVGCRTHPCSAPTRRSRHPRRAAANAGRIGFVASRSGVAVGADF